ncbi:hypothetical protein QE152_g7893 [Popillia japonica]|uniref:Uncharacterized protein n=1 Tax=Popillia japonica TaxID=7064 RepID=A0AAW1MDQ4_POPJA
MHETSRWNSTSLPLMRLRLTLSQNLPPQWRQIVTPLHPRSVLIDPRVVSGTPPSGSDEDAKPDGLLDALHSLLSQIEKVAQAIQKTYSTVEQAIYADDTAIYCLRLVFLTSLLLNSLRFQLWSKPYTRTTQQSTCHRGTKTYCGEGCSSPWTEFSPGLDGILSWTARWRLHINNSKCVAVRFTTLEPVSSVSGCHPGPEANLRSPYSAVDLPVRNSQGNSRTPPLQEERAFAQDCPMVRLLGQVWPSHI